MGIGDWGLGTLRQAQCIAGDWGLGIGDWINLLITHYSLLITHYSLLLTIGDWGHFGKLSASLGIGDWINLLITHYSLLITPYYWGLGIALRLRSVTRDWGLRVRC
nr:hypothetical protein [Gloeotrichia echinulata DEX184]MCM0594513.1 hypothetical protein [Gloeotrichia echinulata DEX184]